MLYHSENHLHLDMVKLVSVCCYLTIIGWLISFVLYGKHGSPLARFHLRQSLGLIITGALLSFIPLVGWLLNVGVILLWFVGIYRAFHNQRYHIPFINDFYQTHLDFIR